MMNYFKNSVCIGIYIIAFLTFTGCGGGGGSDATSLEELNSMQIGILLTPPNADINWHGSVVAEHEVIDANLKMELYNEDIHFWSHTIDGGRFWSSGYHPNNGQLFDGNIWFSSSAADNKFIWYIDALSKQYYFGKAEIKTWGPWTNSLYELSDEILTISVFENYNRIFSPGKWYNVTLNFTNVDSWKPIVDFIFEYYEEKTEPDFEE